jgi:hypothetical protein
MKYALAVGDLTAAEQLEVAVSTLARAIAGWPIQRATRTHMLSRFARVRGIANAQAELGTVTLDVKANRP